MSYHKNYQVQCFLNTDETIFSRHTNVANRLSTEQLLLLIFVPQNKLWHLQIWTQQMINSEAHSITQFQSTYYFIIPISANLQLLFSIYDRKESSSHAQCNLKFISRAITHNAAATLNLPDLCYPSDPHKVLVHSLVSSLIEDDSEAPIEYSGHNLSSCLDSANLMSRVHRLHYLYLPFQQQVPQCDRMPCVRNSFHDPTLQLVPGPDPADLLFAV